MIKKLTCRRVFVHHTIMHHATSCRTCVFNCNLPPAPLAELPRSFTCYCGNTGVAWNAGYRNKCQHRKLALEMKLLSPLLQVPFLQLIQKLAWYQPLPRPPSSSAIAGPAASLSNRISASPSSIELLIVIHGG